MWTRWTLRARTTAAATAVLVPVLLVSSVAGVRIQRTDLTDGVAALAEDQARALAADVPDEAAGTEGSVVQVVDIRTGTVRIGPPDAAALAPAPAGTSPVHSQVAAPLPGENDRYETVALRSVDGDTYVVVARSLEAVDAATTSTTILLLMGSLLVLLTTSGLTWWTTGRALSPVESMRRRARSISARDLEGRLPVPPTDDELARLATTLNDLLDRVDESTQNERRFVADASHELRSPVATIKALMESDRLSPHPGGPDGLAAEVLAETDRLAGIVDQLLLLARGDVRPAPARDRVDLTAVVTAECRRARNVDLRPRVEPGLVVTGDARLLAVALRNVIDNAERHATRAVEVSASAAGDRVTVVVEDDGAGIAAAQRERVFERFVRLDDSRSPGGGGAGLGLAITRQVAESHGGTVSIADPPPAADATMPGVRVVIDLPIALGAD